MRKNDGLGVFIMVGTSQEQKTKKFRQEVGDEKTKNFCFFSP